MTHREFGKLMLFASAPRFDGHDKDRREWLRAQYTKRYAKRRRRGTKTGEARR